MNRSPHQQRDALVRGRTGSVCDDSVVEVTVRYFDGCPHWQTVDDRLRGVLHTLGRADVTVVYEKVETPEDVERLGFVGSPTLLIDGHDPFGVPNAAVGLACRVYRTPAGLEGSPTVEQLTEVLR
jgi:hypothetical protein